MPKRDPKSSEGRFAYQGLERSIHEKARLGIMTSLLTHPEGVSFNDLKTLCDLTDGNLSRHLDVLEEDGLVSVKKVTGPGRTLTTCRLTAAGRKRFLGYLEELQRVVSDATGAAATNPAGLPLAQWKLSLEG